MSGKKKRRKQQREAMAEKFPHLFGNTEKKEETPSISLDIEKLKEEEEKPLLLISDEIYQRKQVGNILVDALLGKPIKRDKAYLSWKGPKIPFTLWQQVLTFFEWTYDEFKGESIVRLYVNEETNDWKVLVFPQTPDGMTIKEIDDSEEAGKIRASLPEGYRLMGTMHHHCSGSAFQSSVDHGDETSKKGFHATIGLIDKEVHDIHCRASFGGKIYNTNLQSWVEIPPKYETLKTLIGQEAAITHLARLYGETPGQEAEFPEEWATVCRRRANIVTRGYTPPTHFSGNQYVRERFDVVIPWNNENGVRGDLLGVVRASLKQAYLGERHYLRSILDGIPTEILFWEVMARDADPKAIIARKTEYCDIMEDLHEPNKRRLAFMPISDLKKGGTSETAPEVKGVPSDHFR